MRDLGHACFSIRRGEAIRTPALDPVACRRVERNGLTAIVREELPIRAVGALFRDCASLAAEVEMEQVRAGAAPAASE